MEAIAGKIEPSTQYNLPNASSSGMACQATVASRKDKMLANQTTGKRWKASKNVERFTSPNSNSGAAVEMSVTS
jgi:hypothetical protein